jgi:transposase
MKTAMAKQKAQITKARNDAVRTNREFVSPILPPPAPSASLKTRQIELRLSKKQKTIIKHWFGCARYCYNKAVEMCDLKRLAHLKKEEHLTTKTRWTLPTLEELRKAIVYNENYQTEDKRWMLSTPTHIRANAVKAVLNAYKSNFALLARGHTTHFKLKFKSKTARSDSIVIEQDAFSTKHRTIYPTLLGMKALNSRENIPIKLEHDTNLVRTRTGRYYLCLLRPLDERPKNLGASPIRAIALDPGNRKFICGYDTEGNVISWGVHDQNLIRGMAHKYDDL